MSRVLTTIEVPGQASDAEAMWYELSRWPAFVDGFGHVERVVGDWPKTGAELTWSSSPGGRGRVLESVTRYESRVGQTLEVEDEQLRGTQRVGFDPQPESVKVTLELEYSLKGRPAFGPIFDYLFVRRPMRESMTRTLLRFRREVVAEAGLRDEQA